MNDIQLQEHFAIRQGPVQTQAIFSKMWEFRFSHNLTILRIMDMYLCLNNIGSFSRIHGPEHQAKLLAFIQTPLPAESVATLTQPETTPTQANQNLSLSSPSNPNGGNNEDPTSAPPSVGQTDSNHFALKVASALTLVAGLTGAIVGALMLGSIIGLPIGTVAIAIGIKIGITALGCGFFGSGMGIGYHAFCKSSKERTKVSRGSMT